jgi:hypothetical protein
MKQTWFSKDGLRFLIENQQNKTRNNGRNEDDTKKKNVSEQLNNSSIINMEIILDYWL